MMLVSHARVLKKAAQAEALKKMSDEFWIALDMLKEELTKVDELQMDRRWACVLEAQAAIANAEALVENEHDLSLAALRNTLLDVSQADGPVSPEYVRAHIKELELALAKAREVGFREEALVQSAEAELESAKSVLAHAIVMRSCIDKNPLNGHGAGTCIEYENRFCFVCLREWYNGA